MHPHTTALSIALIAAAYTNAQNTLRVPDDFPTIQAALDAAQDDDTIELAAGTYRELALFPLALETIAIRGAGPDNTVWSGDIDGDGIPDGSQLSETPGDFAPGVTIQGISFVNGGGEGGGAVSLFFTERSSVFEDCTFINNVADFNGAAIDYSGRTRLTIRRCSFVHNHSGGSGAVACFSRGLQIESSTFLGNRAEGDNTSAGALRHIGIDTQVDSPLVVTDSSFVGNTGRSVGAVFVAETSEFINCTFAGNTPILDVPNTHTTVVSLLTTDAAGRLVGGDVTGSNTIVQLSETAPAFRYNSVGTWTPSLGAHPIPSDTTFLDPLFVRNPDDGGDGWGDDPATPDIDESLNDDFGDLRLRAGSPAIDAGTNDVFTAGDVDLDGNPRLADDPGIPGNNVDIGAYEFQGTTCLADVNQDGAVTPNDFNAWVLAFNDNSPLADQNRNGIITPNDFSAWVLNFNTGC